MVRRKKIVVTEGRGAAQPGGRRRGDTGKGNAAEKWGGKVILKRCTK